MFQILIKDEEGHDVLQPEQFDEKEADFIVEKLKESGISAVKVFREARKYQVIKVVYRLEDIENEKKWRTYADPDELAKEGDIVLLQNTDANKSTSKALVVKTEKQTLNEIKTFCKSIGYRKLGKIIKVLWSPKRK